jgi:hypothetical protein
MDDREITEEVQAKEPLKDSSRFRVFTASIILEMLTLGAGWASATYGWEIPQELLQDVSLTIAGLAIAFIGSRTFRNTPTK